MCNINFVCYNFVPSIILLCRYCRRVHTIVITYDDDENQRKSERS